MKSLNAPKVSVVMAVYNTAEYVREGIDSILNQSFEDFEFIIINDGSTDNLLEIIETFDDPRIILINQRNQGRAVALNNGIIQAKSNIIARFDADDISYSDRLEIQFNYMESNPNCIALGSNADVIDKDGNYIYRSNQPLSSHRLKSGLPLRTPFIHPSTVFRRDIFLKAGKYPDIIIEDLLLFNKMASLGDFSNIEQPLIKYRISPSACTRRSKETNKILRKIVVHFDEYGYITDKQLDEISRSLTKTNTPEKYYQYHLLLTKKYLWNNYSPSKAREQIKFSFQYKQFPIVMIGLYICSCFPKKLITKFYHFFKWILTFQRETHSAIRMISK